jgi:hypothetical protein
MKPGVTVGAARAELRAIGDRLAQTYPDTNAGVSLTAEPLRELWIGHAPVYLRLLFAAVALVQVTVCANVVTAGAGVGAVAALILHRVMASVVQGEHSAAAVVLSVTVTLAAAAALAAWHPVRRALRVDPREALRAE